MRKLGMVFQPDPCEFGCIWQTFSQECLQIWAIFKQVTKQWRDSKTKELRFEIDWGAVQVVFDAYDIEDRREGLSTIFFLMSHLTRTSELTDLQILGQEEIPDTDG